MNRFCGLGVAVLLSLATIPPAEASGLPVAKQTLVVKNRDVDISIKYPHTGNTAVDATLLTYAKDAVTAFKASAIEKQAGENAYTLETTYKVERNDAKMFAVVFGEYTYTGGAHPNSNTVTYNFLLPDGAQVFLPEIVDGSQGIARISSLAIATLVKTVGSGPEPLTTMEMIVSGAGPLAENFKAFVWLPDKLHIYFPPYQVAAYAAGAQEVVIPLAQLREVIRPDWRAPAPSFDCKKARTRIETAICADAMLARLDRQTAEVYQTKLGYTFALADKEKLRQSQRDWIETRDKSCTGAMPGKCLAKVYRDRVMVLTRPPSQNR